jgi:hypothetical protein
MRTVSVGKIIEASNRRSKDNNHLKQETRAHD